MRKKRQREREAAHRAETVEKLARQLQASLGTALPHFANQLCEIDPFKLRARLVEIADAMEPEPKLEIDEAKIAELRAKFQSQPRPATAGGFVIKRIGE